MTSSLLTADKVDPKSFHSFAEFYPF